MCVYVQGDVLRQLKETCHLGSLFACRRRKVQLAIAWTEMLNPWCPHAPPACTFSKTTLNTPQCGWGRYITAESWRVIIRWNAELIPAMQLDSNKAAGIWNQIKSKLIYHMHRIQHSVHGTMKCLLANRLTVVFHLVCLSAASNQHEIMRSNYNNKSNHNGSYPNHPRSTLPKHLTLNSWTVWSLIERLNMHWDIHRDIHRDILGSVGHFCLTRHFSHVCDRRHRLRHSQ